MMKTKRKTKAEIKRAVDRAMESGRKRRIAMEKQALIESHTPYKRWQELGGENMTQENFEEILRRASMPFPLKPDQEKSQTSA